MTSEEKQTQEFNSLRNIPDSFKKIVIVNGSKKPWRNDEGFVIMGMKYFLLNACGYSQKKGTLDLIEAEDIREIFDEIESSPVMETLWKTYQKNYSYAADIPWHTIMKSICALYGDRKSVV